MLLTAEHGPTGTEVLGLRMTTEMERSLALYLGRTHACTHAPTHAPRAEWTQHTRRQMPWGVLGHIRRGTVGGLHVSGDLYAERGYCVDGRRCDEVGLAQAQDELRMAFEKDPSSFRQLLNQTTNPVSARRNMMGWLWFWQAVDAASARRKVRKVSWRRAPADAGGLPTGNPVSDSKLSTAIKAWMPAMLPEC